MTDRGVSPVVGLILIVGLSAIGAMTILVVSSTIVDGTQQSAERQMVERSMTQVADTAQRVASDEVDHARFEIRGDDDGSTEVDEDAGHIEMWIDNGSGTETLLDDDLGAYRYETSDGDVVVFQGGGVWRSDGDGNARMVDPPSFEYRNQGEATLTYRHVRIVGDASGDGVTSGELIARQRTEIYPTADDSNPLDRGTVYLTVESEYCTGWQEFFEERTDSALAERCGETNATVQGELLIELSVPFSVDGLEHGVWTGNYSEGYNGSSAVDSDELEEGDYDPQSADPLVESRADECDPGDMTSLSGTVDTPGLHCTQEIDASITVDTAAAGDDVEIYARDGMEDGTSIDVTGAGGNVSVYFDDDVEFGGGGSSQIGNSSDPPQTRLYLNSSADFEQVGNGDVYALLYAPQSNVTFQSGGSGDFDGAIVAQDVQVDSASLDIEYDTSFSSVRITEAGAGDPFYYLHISETRVEVEPE